MSIVRGRGIFAASSLLVLAGVIACAGADDVVGSDVGADGGEADATTGEDASDASIDVRREASGGGDAQVDARADGGADAGADATTSQDSGGDATSSSDASGDSATDGAPPDDGSVAQIVGIAPVLGTVGQLLTLTVDADDALATSTVVVDGTAVPTIVSSGTSGRVSFEAAVSGAVLSFAGEHEVRLQRGAAPSSRSAPAYVGAVEATDGGAPFRVIDIGPDEGIAGDVITVYGTGLGVGPLTVADSANHQVTATASTVVTYFVGTTGTSGSTAAVQRFTFTLPVTWQSGPLTVSSAARSYRTRPFLFAENHVRSGTTVAASTIYSQDYVAELAVDRSTESDWFADNFDCATDSQCTSTPTFDIAFDSPRTVARVRIRGSRRFPFTYNFRRVQVSLYGPADAGGALWSQTRWLPDPLDDGDLLVSPAVAGVTRVELVSVEDRSIEPGLSEIGVFAE